MQRKILTVYHKHRPGGHCKRLYMLAEELLQRGYEVHYISAEPLHISPHPQLHPHVLKLPCEKNRGWWFWFCFSVAAFFAFIFLSFRIRPNKIAVFDPIYGAMAKPASLLVRAPIVLFLRSVPWRVNLIGGRWAITRGLAYAIDYLGFISAKEIVAVTAVMRDEIVARIPRLANRIRVFPNAVITPTSLENGGTREQEHTKWERWLDDLPKRKRANAARFGIPEKHFLIVTTGELSSRRNVEYLVRAVGAITNERLGLIICGDGEERTKLHVLQVGLGLEEQVVLAGWVDDPIPIVSGCDLFVMPSRHEGMSNSMLEAFGVGVPVIAADTPEMRDVLVHEELLFDPTHVGKLAKKLERIMANRAELDRIKMLSSDRAKQFRFDWGKEVVGIVEGVG